MSLIENLMWVLKGLIEVVERHTPEDRCEYDQARLDQARMALEKAEKEGY
jgi:hypothetical protein